MSTPCHRTVSPAADGQEGSTERRCHHSHRCRPLHVPWPGNCLRRLFCSGSWQNFWRWTKVVYLTITFLSWSRSHICFKMLLFFAVFNLSPDVAGATFMAAGSSGPELATAVIGVFVAKVSYTVLSEDQITSWLLYVQFCPLTKYIEATCQIVAPVWWKLQCTIATMAHLNINPERQKIVNSSGKRSGTFVPLRKILVSYTWWAFWANTALFKFP